MSRSGDSPYVEGMSLRGRVYAEELSATAWPRTTSPKARRRRCPLVGHGWRRDATATLLTQ